jgi:hypothetical protein
MLAGVVVLASGAHLLFSGIGFNPTDEGFTLAGAKRILAGQIPHRDFISTRPAFSFLLHVPEVWLGGQSILLNSRLVFWLEMAVGALGWVLLLEWACRRTFTSTVRLALLGTVFPLNAHVFPPMAWHSVDAMTLAALGLALVARSRKAGKLAGYAMLGLSTLCRQNFIPLLPVALFVFGDARRMGCWVSAMAPVIAYATVISIAGGWNDMVLQLAARTDIVGLGFSPFAGHKGTWFGLATGFLAAWLVTEVRPGKPRLPGLFWPGIGLSTGAVLFAVSGLVRGTIAADPAFFIWGATAGAGAFMAFMDAGRSRAPILIAATGWCIGVSVGYNTPALMAGACAAVMVAMVVDALEKRHPRAARLLVTMLAVMSLAAMARARQIFVYRDRPASALTVDLGTVFPGGDGIRTSGETGRFFADLAFVVKRCGGHPYAIIPDCAVWWATAPSGNPICEDWPMNAELVRPELFMRVGKDLMRQRGRIYVIVQKYRAESIATERRLIGDDQMYGVVALTRKAFRKTGETEFFEIYR